MWDVKIVQINKIEPIPDADKIELVYVGDWSVVGQKGLWQVGMLAAYIPYDSVLPANLIESLGLVGKLSGPAKNRVKPIKLRGQLSIGLLAPAPSGTNEGDSVAEMLGITKYEQFVPPHLAGKQRSHPEGWSKYDIDNIRSDNHFIDGEEIVISSKLHGCFHKNTPVLMANNQFKDISLIQHGDLVKSFNFKTQKFENKLVKYVVNSGKSDQVSWIELTLSNKKTIICTANHLFLTTKGWKEAKFLSPNDELVTTENK